MAKFEFGDSAKDIVSGFAGIVTGRFEYLNGCVRYAVDPSKIGKDGKVIDGMVFDEGQLVLVKRGVVKVPPRDIGGPMPTPKLQSNPTR